MTEIDGLDVHFIRVRSQHENALPVIITHGWPGSATSGTWRKAATRGAIITDLMAARAPPGLLGMHTNMPGAVPPMSRRRWRVTCSGPAARRHPACPPRKAARTNS